MSLKTEVSKLWAFLATSLEIKSQGTPRRFQNTLTALLASNFLCQKKLKSMEKIAMTFGSTFDSTLSFTTRKRKRRRKFLGTGRNFW